MSDFDNGFARAQEQYDRQEPPDDYGVDTEEEDGDADEDE